MDAFRKFILKVKKVKRRGLDKKEKERQISKDTIQITQCYTKSSGRNELVIHFLTQMWKSEPV